MTFPSIEKSYDELLRLLEEEKGWSERIGMLSETEMDQYRLCQQRKRIGELLLGLASNGRGRL